MATIDDLLRRLHRQAAGLRASPHPARQLEDHLRGWITLATQARRLVSALTATPEDRDLLGLLESLRGGLPVPPGRVDPGLEAVALTTGAIGDVLTGAPAVVGQAGETERARLEASIEAALYATALATCDLARRAGQDPRVRAIRAVAEATEPAALIPPTARISTLERLTITRLTPDTADGAVQRWASAATRAFSDSYSVTGVALQDCAATLAILCRVSSDTLHQAAVRGVIDPESGSQAEQLLANASTAWRKAATWPSWVQLGGSADEHRQAAKAVRDALTGPRLQQLTLPGRTHTLRAALVAAVDIGQLQSTTVAWVANQGGLWVAHERANLRPPGVHRRRVKLDWEPLRWEHPVRRLLVDAATVAHTTLGVAAAATDHAVFPMAPPRGDLSPIAIVDDRIVADGWESVEGASSIHRRNNVAVPGVSTVDRTPRR